MLRLVLVATLAALAMVFVLKVDLDERMMWAGLLPLVYVVGLIVLRD